MTVEWQGHRVDGPLGEGQELVSSDHRTIITDSFTIYVRTRRQCQRWGPGVQDIVGIST